MKWLKLVGSCVKLEKEITRLEEDIKQKRRLLEDLDSRSGEVFADLKHEVSRRFFFEMKNHEETAKECNRLRYENTDLLDRLTDFRLKLAVSEELRRGQDGEK